MIHRIQRLLLGIVVFWLASPSGLVGQSEEYAAIKWWHPVAASAGIAALFLVDQPIQDFWEDNRSETLGDISDVAKKFKEPEVFIAAAPGAMALGLMLDEPVVARTGLQILGAYGLSSGMMIATKWAFGRSRPSDTPEDHTNFDWFNGDQNNAFPSGSAAVVFSLATTVADAVDYTAISVVLYSGAVLNSWSRVYGERHWFTDVALGALYGVTAAKLVNGRWRVFGLRPPTVIVGPEGRASFGYQVDF
jgi:membrane-associated phospholipid phosphatase